MASSAPLEVKVIYDASSSRRRGGAPVVRTGVRHTRWLVVGLINLLVAGAVYYGLWWRVDREIVYPALIMHSTIPGLDNFADQVSGKAGAARAEPEAATTDARTIKLWSVAYGWRTLTAIAFCTLALSGGSLLGRYFGGPARRAGIILFVGAILGLGLAAYIIWTNYEIEYKPSHFRWFVGGVAGALLLLGLTIGRGVRALGKSASLFLMLSALGSVAGMYVYRDIGVLSPEKTTIGIIGLVFVAHSLWACMLWPLAARLPR